MRGRGGEDEEERTRRSGGGAEEYNGPSYQGMLVRQVGGSIPWSYLCLMVLDRLMLSFWLSSLGM